MTRWMRMTVITPTIPTVARLPPTLALVPAWCVLPTPTEHSVLASPSVSPLSIRHNPACVAFSCCLNVGPALVNLPMMRRQRSYVSRLRMMHVMSSKTAPSWKMGLMQTSSSSFSPPSGARKLSISANWELCVGRGHWIHTWSNFINYVGMQLCKMTLYLCISSCKVLPPNGCTRHV